MLYRKSGSGDRTQCLLCPHLCTVSPHRSGKCGVRENRNGEIILSTYGIISGFALDPVEKKPLYHFFPGRYVLSVGSFGCNFSCDFCQNYRISQGANLSAGQKMMPGELVSRALTAHDNIGIAYTYNEPVIWFEYVSDCARLASREGLKNILVTNGYINPGPLDELIEVTDAFNIDLKAFNDTFYRKYTGGSIKPVLETIRKVAASGKHLEITTLIIPGLNDSADQMKKQAQWIAANAGPWVPLHISRYFPTYLRDNPPTPPETILALRDIAADYLEYVYTGNMHELSPGSDTECPECRAVVIRRAGYRTEISGLSPDGRCLKCNKKIIRAS